MKRILSALSCFLILSALFGCAGDPQKSQVRGDFKIETLFTHEGVTVYRFNDCGNYVYFASKTSTSYRESNGEFSWPVLTVTDGE